MGNSSSSSSSTSNNDDVIVDVHGSEGNAYTFNENENNKNKANKNKNISVGKQKLIIKNRKRPPSENDDMTLGSIEGGGFNPFRRKRSTRSKIQRRRKRRVYTRRG